MKQKRVKDVLKVALRLTFGRRSRLISSIIGISLGFTMAFSLQILLNTVKVSSDNAVVEQYGNYDLMIGYQTSKQMLHPSDIRFIKTIPGIASSTPELYPYLEFGGTQNNTVYVGTANNPLSQQVKNQKIESGHFPTRNEIAVNQTFLKLHGYRVGDTITLPIPQHASQRVKIVGLLSNDNLSNAPPVVLFNISWLRELTDNLNNTTVVVVKLHNHVSIATVETAIRSRLPRVYIDTRPNVVNQKKNLDGLLPIVLALSIMSIIASSLILFSTMQIAIQERLREYATLRLLGASRVQLVLMVITESTLLGGFGVLLGLASSIALSLALSSIVCSFLNVPPIGISIPIRTLSVMIPIAIMFTATVGSLPAMAAASVPPVTAFRQSFKTQGEIGFVQGRIMPLMFCVTVGLVIYFVFYPRSTWVDLSVSIAMIVISFAGIPGLATRGTSLVTAAMFMFNKAEKSIAFRNALRHMSKSKAIISILSLSMTLAIAGASLLIALDVQTQSSIKNEYPTQLTLSSALGTSGGFSNKLYSAVSTIPGVKAVYDLTPIICKTVYSNEGYNRSNVSVNTSQVEMALEGVPIQQIANLMHVKILHGTISPSAMAKGGVVVTEADAEHFHLSVGTVITLDPLSGLGTPHVAQKNIHVTVVGVVSDIPTLHGYTQYLYASPEFVSRTYGVDNIQNIQVDISEAVDKNQTIQSIETELHNPLYSHVTLVNREQLLRNLRVELEQRIAMLGIGIFCLASLAFLGLINGVASNLRERIREFAVLRAIGSSKRQVVRIIMLEGVFLAAFGSFLGSFCGTGLGLVLMKVILGDEGYFPVLFTMAMFLIGAGMGVVAPFLPAMAISRHNTSDMLQQD